MNADTSLTGNAYFLDEDDMASDSDEKVPSQQSVKSYADSRVNRSSLENSQAYRPWGIDTYLTALESAATTPVNVVVIGDSISIANCVGGETAYPYFIDLTMNNLPFTNNLRTGWRTASGNDTGTGTQAGAVPGMLTNPWHSGSLWFWWVLHYPN